MGNGNEDAPANALDRLPGQRSRSDGRVRAASGLEQATGVPAGAAPGSGPRLIPTGLPVPPTMLIGREREVAAGVAALLQEDVRLLTLTGPAGVGKTRLALQLAHEVQEAYPDGIRFVDLTPLRDPRSVPSTIALALRDQAGGPGRSPAATPGTPWGSRRLLVLDGFEHLLEASPRVAELLAAHPTVKLLVTSRARLRLRAEHTLPVLPLAVPLAVPDGHSPSTVQALAAVPAVALFAERARASDPAFALTVADAPAIAALTVHLEGLPLALELAATRAHVLTPAEMLVWVEHRLQALALDAPDLPARHRSLREALAWSYTPLPPAEQALFRRLAVFAGGWTRPAAEEVTGLRELGLEPIDALTRLVDASLVQVSGHGREGRRFGLLETLREFAAEQLAASGEAEATRRQHAAYYAALAEHAAPALEGSQQGAWLRSVEREHPNLQTALTWAADCGEADLELRLAGNLGYFWWAAGHLREGRARLEAALARSPNRRDGLHQKALQAGGLLASWLGEGATAAAWSKEALDLAMTLGDGPGIMSALGTLAIGAWCGGGGRHDQTAAVVEQVERARPAADPWSLGFATHAVGVLAHRAGDQATATTYLGESLTWCRRAGDRSGVIRALLGLALAAQAQGSDSRAVGMVEEALSLLADLDGPLVLTWCCGFAAAEVSARRAPEAARARVLGALGALRVAGRVPISPHQRLRYDRTVAALRAALGEEVFARAWADGCAMTPDDLADALLALLDGGAASTPSHRRDVEARHPGGPRTRSLSPREREVLLLVSDGATNRQVATALVVTEATARFHVASLINKLGAANRTQAVTLARGQGLL